MEDISLIDDVRLKLTVELGSTQITVKELLAQQIGSVLKLNAQAGELLTILANGKPIARGEVVETEDNFYGIRFVEIIK